ncbi:MAG: IS21-like element helper ATPase IstB [Planctomycetes bacterium]|nr:IS21-like element helper ATPase IstB [Planctomycetota bacterium]
MEINESLKTVLKRLKLSGLLHTLPDRIAYAKKTKLSYQELLELVLQDEIDRREQGNLDRRLRQAQFQDEQTFENFDWNAKATFDRETVKDLFGLSFIGRKEDVIFLGPVGVGKTFLASALGHAACRAGKRVLFIRADRLLKELYQSRADHTTEKVVRRFISQDLLIIDDFGLRKMDATQSSDLYEIIIERHRRSSTLLTSNRSIEEWIPLFTDPVLSQSAIDRLAHNAHQIVMEGESYRKQQGPAARRKPKNRKKEEPET